MDTPLQLEIGGAWLLRPDPENVGIKEEWWRAPGEPANWQEIEVPSGWQTALGINDPPVAWYKRLIDIPRAWLATSGAHIWIRFAAVATEATVWVNGLEMGRHTGNWAPFQFDITPAVAPAPGKKGPSTPEQTNAEMIRVEVIVRVDKIPATPPEWIDGAPVFGGHITKGFHDVLSLQTAGIWDTVTLRRTGGACIAPHGVSITTNPETGWIQVRGELSACGETPLVTVNLFDPQGSHVEKLVEPLLPGDTKWETFYKVKDPQNWSPDMPRLYTAHIAVSEVAGDDSLIDEVTVRFGFRTVKVGGEDKRRLLLNDAPLFLRGVLDWGHEPRHLTPTPTRDEVRDRFTYLRKLGFNCVCLCMWYPPEHFYEVADETGMLIWQEHPVWKSWMGDELVEAYKEQYLKFFRRDAAHTSVVVVSGSCEHERLNPALTEWWWTEARKRLPDRVLQIQTAFFAWTDPAKTDLWDEHTYESSGRWVRYLDELQEALKEKDPKPFVMGESILYTSWPDIDELEKAAKNVSAAERQARKSEQTDGAAVLATAPKGETPATSTLHWRREDGAKVVAGDVIAALETTEQAVIELPALSSGILKQEVLELGRVTPGARIGAIIAEADTPASPTGPAWWFPRGFEELAKFERGLVNKYGPKIGEQLRRHGDKFHLQGRKFQMERFRSYPNHAGHVMNHLRDVPACRCGFQDDLGRWRFAPEQMRSWMGETILILATPSHRRGFIGGQRIACRMGMSNFSARPFAGRARVLAEGGGKRVLDATVSLECPVGDVAWTAVEMDLPAVAKPTRVVVRAETSDGGVRNEWALWILPQPGRNAIPGLSRFAGLDFVDADDMFPDFEEHAYSSGWGLKVKNWVCPLPNPAKLVPDAAVWRHGSALPEGPAVIVSHKLTDKLVEFMDKGGRVVHLTSKTVGSVPNQYVSMWGQVPLLASDRFLGEGYDEVLLDLLDHDLTRRVVRTVPSGQLGIADMVDPLVRLVVTHDMQERPKLMDSVFAARVGGGILVVSSLDHSEDAGAWLLHELLAFAAKAKAEGLALLDPREVRRWTVETMLR